jgi:hypothetical protein
MNYAEIGYADRQYHRSIFGLEARQKVLEKYQSSVADLDPDP